MRFPVIVADPPWAFETWSAGNWRINRSSREVHYQTEGTEWIKGLPVQEVAAEDCVLLLWITWPTLPLGLEVIESWGFTYKTLGFDWIKTSGEGKPLLRLGYWTRANSEPCLLATRGKPKRCDKGVSQVLACGPGRHSEKPFEFFDRVERLLEGPYLELFARPHGSLIEGERDGWTRLGNEITGNDITVDLEALAAQ